MSEMVYVLMEEGWEYNDETFFHPESGSGTPRKVFATNEAAQKECDARNVESLRDLFVSGEANQYFYNIEDILPYPERKDPDYRVKLEAIVSKIFGTTLDGVNDALDDQEEMQFNPETTDEDWLKFQSMINLNFWNVVEVEKE